MTTPRYDLDLAPGIQFDQALMDEIDTSLALRRPNRDAAESVIIETSQFFDVEGGTGTYTAVVDAATGVGKTYTMAALIDYYAQANGWSHFLIVTPGTIVRDKTIENFTAGHDKAIPGIATRIEVITADNFDTLATSVVMDDPSVAKVYVWTIDALTPPTERAKADSINKKTHTVQETTGNAFYEHLREQDNLVILADEYHVYQTDGAYQKTVKGLDARLVVGLSATPKTKGKGVGDVNIVYRYPLAAAIAEGFVKKPTIVGRRDDRADLKTQLLDGLAIVEAKRVIAARNAETLGRMINPVMLVIAKNIAEAADIEAMITARTFANGMYTDAVIRIDSETKSARESEEIWARLRNVEDPRSSVRVIVSVGMLKEGWDVKNVYVMLSSRALASNTLTEQTLGRGLRLPYGKRTGVQLLDLLEVLWHQKYDTLITNAKSIKEEFVSYRTRATVRRNSETGRLEREHVREVVQPDVTDAAGETVTTPDLSSEAELLPGMAPLAGEGGKDTEGTPTITEPETPAGFGAAIQIVDIDEHLAKAQEQSSAKPVEMPLRPEVAKSLRIPVLTTKAVEREFSLSSITNLDEFASEGRRIASDPSSLLRRTIIDSEAVRALDGTLTTRIVTREAKDLIRGHQEAIPVEEARKSLVAAVLNSDVVPKRGDVIRRERSAAERIVDAFIEGLNGQADMTLSAYMGRATTVLLRLVAQENAKVHQAHDYELGVAFIEPKPTRTLTKPTVSDLTSRLPIVTFRSLAFEGWQKSSYKAEWFDSHPERDMARLLDSTSNPIRWWLRLHAGDLVIRIDQANVGNYEPDFIALDNDGKFWVIEVKAQNLAEDPGVMAKRDGAIRWAQNVNDNAPEGTPTWGYMLAFQDELASVHDDWNALVKRTGAR